MKLMDIPQRWVWVKWRSNSYAIDAYKIVTFGRMLSTENEVWYRLIGENENSLCESSMVDFCALIGAPYNP